MFGAELTIALVALSEIRCGSQLRLATRRLPHSRRQLLANATIAASRVAARGCCPLGATSLRQPKPAFDSVKAALDAVKARIDQGEPDL